LPYGSFRSWGAFYAERRLLPYARSAADAGSLSGSDVRAVEAVCAPLVAGEWDDGRAPVRLHGDLWSGNVLWCRDGAVLVDPAAHGGHAETDLAMLALFGLPHLERVLAAYDESAPLADGWRDRVGLHQLHPLLVHAVLFGGGYGVRAGELARRYA
jgi:fructosamine-3-kinase